MQTVPTPPTPPAPPTPPDPALTSPELMRRINSEIVALQAQGPAAPLTSQQIAAIRARRTELSNQLNSAADRRDALAKRLESAEGASRAGLEQRIAVLDRRIVQLETDIAETGRQLTAPTSALTSSTAQPPLLERMDPSDLVGLGVTFVIIVLGPLAIAMSRLLWKRASAPLQRPAAADAATAARLERIEQAVDAIALEVERVSEGQRFVTRILADPRPGQAGAAALSPGVGPAEPVRVPNAGAIPAARSR